MDAQAGSVESSLLDNNVLKHEPCDADTIPGIAGSTTNEKPFRFLDLPPEIRNKVYQYRCVFETPSLLQPHFPWAATFKDLRQAPVTRVNKQIRNETLPIFYGEYYFFIYLHPLPSDWQSLRPRHQDYRDPVELVWNKLNAFTPDQNTNLQANSLQFLSNLAFDIRIEPSRQFRLADLGFTMSSTELECDEDTEEEQLVKTADLDWNKCIQVKDAYLAAVDSCPLVLDANDLLSVPGVCCLEVDQAASALATLMCRIAKLCPHLTTSVSAFINPSYELSEELSEAQALQWVLNGEIGSHSDV